MFLGISLVGSLAYIKIVYDKLEKERKEKEYYYRVASQYYYSTSYLANSMTRIQKENEELRRRFQTINKNLKALAEEKKEILNELREMKKSLKSSGKKIDIILNLMTTVEKLNEVEIGLEKNREELVKLLERVDNIGKTLGELNKKTERSPKYRVVKEQTVPRISDNTVKRRISDIEAEIREIRQIREELKGFVEEVKREVASNIVDIKRESEEYIKYLSKNFEDLNWATSSRIRNSRELKKKSDSNRGFIVEKLAPFIAIIEDGRKEYIKLRDLIFVGGTAPFDYMVVKGLWKGDIEEIIFLEAKSGLANLSPREMKFAENIIKRRGNFLKYGVVRAVKSNKGDYWEFEVRIIKSVKELKEMVKEVNSMLNR